MCITQQLGQQGKKGIRSRVLVVSTVKIIKGITKIRAVIVCRIIRIIQQLKPRKEPLIIRKMLRNQIRCVMMELSPVNRVAMNQ